MIEWNGERWYKGNLHTHTSVSDGQRDPEEVISLYKSKDYDFLALTDHWRLSETRMDDGLLLLSGVEYDVGTSAKTGIFHVVGIGMEREPAVQRTEGLCAQNLIDGIVDADGLAFLAHPAWSMNRAPQVAALRGLSGVEIYNSVSGVPWNARPYSGQIVDELALDGHLMRCTATDDAHFYNGDETKSFILVKAKELSCGAIKEAIAAGDFFATQGPRFSVQRTKTGLEVTCTPVRDVIFYSDSIFAFDRVTRGEAVTSASYRFQRSDTFVRVELVDLEGNTAWSSPIPV